MNEDCACFSATLLPMNEIVLSRFSKPCLLMIAAKPNETMKGNGIQRGHCRSDLVAALTVGVALPYRGRGSGYGHDLFSGLNVHSSSRYVSQHYSLLPSCPAKKTTETQRLPLSMA